MTIPIYPTQPFVDDVSEVPAAALNHYRTNLAKCIDGTDGGAYTPSTSIDIAGEGLGDVTVKGTVTLTGADAGIVHRPIVVATNYTNADNPVTFPEGYDWVRFTGTFTVGTVQIALPDESNYAGRVLYVTIAQNGGSGAVNVEFRDSTDAATILQVPAQGDSFGTFISDGTNWKTVGWSNNATSVSP